MSLPTRGAARSSAALPLRRAGPPRPTDDGASSSTWATVGALAVLLFAATGFVGSLQDALDKIWDAPPRAGGIWSFIRSKLFSFSLVLAAAFMLLVSLVLSALMTALSGARLRSHFHTRGVPAQLILHKVVTK